ncbi:DUF4199 family protein [Nonlabens ulvanivorans]|uniref:DUF4199 family protein n=1 Tax=Nonlabens ulvanivorans TaxID=906888 RepID=UPI002942D6D8|nr:hypothetical protein [Nonlabens ulvanivorans]WOI22214.1 hypothetical protein R1T42_11120 [Nonlabens ulvanivorans]
MLFSKNTLKISLSIIFLLIAYFLLIASIGVADKVYLSFLNAPIMAIGLYFIIRSVFKSQPNDFKYMDGFLSGLASGFLISIVFTVFMAIYLFEINPDLVQEMSASIPLASGTDEVGLLLFIFLSGVSTAIVSSLLIIPIFKQSWNTRGMRNSQKPLNQNS